MSDAYDALGLQLDSGHGDAVANAEVTVDERTIRRVQHPVEQDELVGVADEVVLQRQSETEEEVVGA